MINPNDNIQFRNVISKKWKVHYTKINHLIEAFFEEVIGKGATLGHTYFYSLGNVLKDEVIDLEMFIPVEESFFELPSDMTFHSYFSIEDMISIHMVNNYEENTESAYAALAHYMVQNQLQQATPIFHLINIENDIQFMTVKIGTTKMTNESVWK